MVRNEGDVPAVLIGAYVFALGRWTASATSNSTLLVPLVTQPAAPCSPARASRSGSSWAVPSSWPACTWVPSSSAHGAGRRRACPSVCPSMAALRWHPDERQARLGSGAATRTSRSRNRVTSPAEGGLRVLRRRRLGARSSVWTGGSVSVSPSEPRQDNRGRPCAGCGLSSPVRPRAVRRPSTMSPSAPTPTHGSLLADDSSSTRTLCSIPSATASRRSRWRPI